MADYLALAGMIRQVLLAIEDLRAEVQALREDLESSSTSEDEEEEAEDEDDSPAAEEEGESALISGLRLIVR